MIATTDDPHRTATAPLSPGVNSEAKAEVATRTERGAPLPAQCCRHWHAAAAAAPSLARPGGGPGGPAGRSDLVEGLHRVENSICSVA